MTVMLTVGSFLHLVTTVLSKNTLAKISSSVSVRSTKRTFHMKQYGSKTTVHSRCALPLAQNINANNYFSIRDTKQQICSEKFNTLSKVSVASYY